MKAINWNHIDDPVDLEVWNRVTANFWLPEKIALSNDIPSWNTMSEAEMVATGRVFANLTLLDTLQGIVGAPTMMQHAQTQHEEAVFANFSFMEAFSGETELLTESGWKRIDQVTESDSVAQYHPETSEISFVNPKVVPPHFSGEVYEIKANNGNARQVVSGGHRVFFERTNKAGVSAVTAEARSLANRKTLSGMKFVTSGEGSKSYGGGMTALDRIFVAIEADGSFDNWTKNSKGEYSRSGVTTGTVPVRFALKKPRKIRRLQNLADQLGWKLVEGKTSRDRIPFTLYVPVEHVGDRMKSFSSWFDHKKSCQWAKDFIYEVAEWDGHKHKNAEIISIHTTRKGNSDFIVAMATLAGYRARTVVRQDDRSDNFSDTYMTTVCLEKDRVSGQSMTINPVEPQMVYCVQVPSTYLVTRNGNTPVVSGNCVHAKSYSSIFTTLMSMEDIEQLFEWVNHNEFTQRKGHIVKSFYDGAITAGRGELYSQCMAKAASVMLESFLFYSGFYLPFYFASRAKLTNTADIIRLILRDEGVHGYYIGYKFQQVRTKLSDSDRDALDTAVQDLLDRLYDNELQFTEYIYDDLGWTENVKTYLRYNANKALANLGYQPRFDSESTNVEPAILANMQLDTAETHDFFSGSGASYVMGTVEETTDDDWY